jgi:hypothetical protein
MADYYEKASFQIRLSEAEKERVKDLISHLNEWECDFWSPGAALEEAKLEPLRPVLEYLVNSGVDLSNTYELDEDGIWVVHDERFDIEEAALFTQCILKLLDKDDVVSFEWSCDCSKPRLDAFGGGCAWVTKDAWDSMTTGTMLENMLAARVT